MMRSHRNQRSALKGKFSNVRRARQSRDDRRLAVRAAGKSSSPVGGGNSWPMSTCCRRVTRASIG